MDLNSTTSPSSDASSLSVPDRREGFHLTISAKALGIMSCAGFVLCLATWQLARWPERMSSQQAATVALASNIQAIQADTFRKATERYWNSIIEQDNKCFDQTLKLVTELQRRMNADSHALVMNYLAAAFKDVFDSYLNGVTRLPMKDVDEALLRHMREELKYGHEGVRALAGMAETANELQEWSNRTKSTDGFVSDCLDSFIQGMMGRPFAGYEKAKRESESFDAEGKRIANAYWQKYQMFMESIQHNEEMRITELELRSSLSAKYGVEFPPRPDPELQTSK